MKRMFFSFFTLVIAGVFFPDEKCKKAMPVLTANATPFDGPYVMYRDGRTYIRYVMEENG
jgi:hypothetical protein